MKSSTTYKRKNNTPHALKKTRWKTNFWDDYNFFTPKKLNKEKGGGERYNTLPEIEGPKII